MGDKSAIDWTDATWNPVTGCNKVSPGCKLCYAERTALRMQRMGQPRYINGFQLTVHPEALDQPIRWQKPRRIFVNSMSDLFHEQVPVDFTRAVLDVIAQTPRHTYQILTKRPEHASKVLDQLPPLPDNVWLGVSVENQDYTGRIDTLRSIPAHVRFLSLEPLLGPLDRLDLDQIHWVIAGGESGPGHHPPKAEWFTSIRDQCQLAQVPFFFKQWGGSTASSNGHILEGQTHRDFPN